MLVERTAISETIFGLDLQLSRYKHNYVIKDHFKIYFGRLEIYKILRKASG